MRRIFSLHLLFLILLSELSLFSQDDNRDWRTTVYALQQSFRDISSRVLPVVVEINVVETTEQDVPSFSPWEFFFGNPQSPPSLLQPQKREYTKTGLGSGVIIDQRGHTVYVITNYHVAGKADEITLSLYDGRQYTAELAGSDPQRDLALISFYSDEPLPLAVLGDSDTIRTGDWVLAIGNPYGFESTVTQGIISATGRVGLDDRANEYLQTDASINSGNSGGALVNIRGEVIGINTWIASGTGGSVGLGFAIPSNRIRENLEDLIREGRVEYGWLGVNMSTATDTFMEQMGLEEWEGAFVFNIYSSSPARDGGLLPGDLIIALDGQPVENSRELAELISRKKPGDRIRVTFVRGERELTKTIELSSKDRVERSSSEISLWPGFTVSEVTDEMRERLELPRYSANLIIGNILENSIAQEAGLHKGDIIKSMNKTVPRDIGDFYRILGESGGDIQMKVERRGYEFEYRLKIQ